MSVGNILLFKKRTSFSKDKHRIFGYQSGEIIVKYVISNGIINGRDISKISFYSDEDEILLSPNSKFEIIKNTFIHPGIVEVTLKPISQVNEMNGLLKKIEFLTEMGMIDMIAREALNYLGKKADDITKGDLKTKYREYIEKKADKEGVNPSQLEFAIANLLGYVAKRPNHRLDLKRA